MHSRGNEEEDGGDDDDEVTRTHTHAVPFRTNSPLFSVPGGLLVVEEALPFCTSIALVSGKHFGFVHRGTCGRNKNKIRTFSI